MKSKFNVNYKHITLIFILILNVFILGLNLYLRYEIHLQSKQVASNDVQTSKVIAQDDGNDTQVILPDENDETQDDLIEYKIEEAEKKWRQELNYSRRDFYGEWMVTELLKRDRWDSRTSWYEENILGKKTIEFGRKDIKQNGRVIGMNPFYEIQILNNPQEYLPIPMEVKGNYIVKVSVEADYIVHQSPVIYIFYLIDADTLLGENGVGSYLKLERVSHEPGYVEKWPEGI